MENHHFQWENSAVDMAIFNNYVKLPEDSFFLLAYASGHIFRGWFKPIEPAGPGACGWQNPAGPSGFLRVAEADVWFTLWYFDIAIEYSTWPLIMSFPIANGDVPYLS